MSGISASKALPEEYFGAVASTQHLERVHLPLSYRELKSKQVAYSVCDEHYLRAEDLPCPFGQCQDPRCREGRRRAEIVATARDAGHKPKYLAFRQGISSSKGATKEATRPHVCIMSHNTLAHYIEFLDSDGARFVQHGGFVLPQSVVSMVDFRLRFPWKRLRKHVLADPNHPTILWRDDLHPLLYPLTARAVHAAAHFASPNGAKPHLDVRSSNVDSRSFGLAPAGSNLIDLYVSVLGIAQWMMGHVNYPLVATADFAKHPSEAHDTLLLSGDMWKDESDATEGALEAESNSQPKQTDSTKSSQFIQRELERIRLQAITEMEAARQASKVATQGLDVIVLDDLLAESTKELNPMSTGPIVYMSVIDYVKRYLDPSGNRSEVYQQIEAMRDACIAELQEFYLPLLPLEMRKRRGDVLPTIYRILADEMRTILTKSRSVAHSPTFDFVRLAKQFEVGASRESRRALQAMGIVDAEFGGALTYSSLVSEYPERLTRRAVKSILELSQDAKSLNAQEDDLSASQDLLPIEVSVPSPHAAIELDEADPEFLRQLKLSTSFGSTFQTESQLNRAGHLYPPYLPESALQVGLRRKIFFEGTVQVQSHSSKVSDGDSIYAIVLLKKPLPLEYGGGKQIAIPSKFACNRTFDGDVVVVALSQYRIQEAETSALSVDFERDEEEELTDLQNAVQSLDNDEDGPEGPPAITMSNSQSITHHEAKYDTRSSSDSAPTAIRSISRLASAKLPRGRVVGLVQRRCEYLVGTLMAEDDDKQTLGWVGRVKEGISPEVSKSMDELSRDTETTETVAQSKYYSVVPMNARHPIVRIQTRQPHVLRGQRLLVHVDTWNTDSMFPNGHFVKALGPVGDVVTEGNAIIAALGLDYKPFNEQMLQHIPDRTAVASKLEEHNRARQEIHSIIISRDSSRYGSNLVIVGHEPEEVDPNNPYLWKVPADALRGRRDLRTTHGECLVSIDPPGCVDIDDALSVKRFSSLAEARKCKVPENVLETLRHNAPNRDSEDWISSLVEVGVHIADVSYWVPEDSPLDIEARDRGTSTYLVGKRFDMLPRSLSEDLASLRGGCDRLAVTVLVYINERTNEIIGHWSGRTVIHNYFAMSYEQAQEMVDNDPDSCYSPDTSTRFILYTKTSEEMLTSLKTGVWPRYRSYSSTQPYQPRQHRLLRPAILFLRDYARVLKNRRLEAGALELASAYTDFALDEQKRAIGFKQHVEIELHDTIAEFMILANAIVAEQIFAAFPHCALLRSHGAPRVSLLGDLERACRLYGVPFDASTNQALASTLNAAARRVLREAMTGSSIIHAEGGILVLKSLATRAMAEAQYHSTGEVGDRSELFHYGLSIPLYTHFTSPIRRYADLIVHRQLLRVLDQEMLPSSMNVVPAVLRSGRATPVQVGDAGQQSTTSPSVSDAIQPALPTNWNNDYIEEIAMNLNRKNRAAKAASKQSQQMYLVIYLTSLLTKEFTAKTVAALMHQQQAVATVPGSVSLVPEILTSQKSFLRSTAVVEAILEGGRRLRLFLPEYQVSAEVDVLDEQSRLNFSPFQRIEKGPSRPENNADVHDDGDEDENVWRPPAEVVGQADGTTVQIRINSKQDLVRLNKVTGQSDAPLEMTLKLFSKLQVDLFVTRSHLSRFYYRLPTPLARLVWSNPKNLSFGQDRHDSVFGEPLYQPTRKEIAERARATAARVSQATPETRSAAGVTALSSDVFVYAESSGYPKLMPETMREEQSRSRIDVINELALLDTADEISRLATLFRESKLKQRTPSFAGSTSRLPKPFIHAAAGRRYVVNPNLRTGQAASRFSPTPAFTKSKRKTIVSEETMLSLIEDEMKAREQSIPSHSTEEKSQVSAGKPSETERSISMSMDKRVLAQSASHHERKVITAARRAGISIRSDYYTADYDPIKMMLQAGLGNDDYSNRQWATDDELEEADDTLEERAEPDQLSALQGSDTPVKVKSFSRRDRDVDALQERMARLNMDDIFAIAHDLADTEEDHD